MTGFNSLRMGFGLGVCVAVLALAWILIPAGPNSELVTANEEVNRTEATVLNNAGKSAGSQRLGGETLASTGSELPAASPHLTRQAQISVVDATTGLPYSELAIDLQLRELEDGGSLGAAQSLQGSTDAEGKLAFSVHSSKLLCHVSSDSIAQLGGSLRPQQFTWSEQRGLVTLQVRLPRGRLTFECIDMNGNAVAGARLSLHQPSKTNPGRFRSIETDQFGRAYLAAERVPGEANTWTIQAQHRDHGAAGLFALTAVADGPAQVIQLVQGAQLTVRVLDQTRKPIAFQRARLQSLAQTEQLHTSQIRSNSSYLDQHGECTWTQLLPGPYRLSVPSPVSREWIEYDIEVEAAIESREFVAQLTPLPVALGGRIVGPQDLPVAHHYIELHDSAGELIAGTRTNANGEFRLYGESATETVIASPQALADRSLNFASERLEFPAGSLDVLLVGHQRKQVEVMVIVRSAETGEPVDDALISSRATAIDFEEQLGRSNAAGICTLLLDAEEALPLGASAAGLASVPFSWDLSAELIEVELPPLESVQLQVIDSYWSTPLANADLLHPETLQLISQTDSNGMVTLVPDPELRFFVRARGYVDSAEIDLAPELSMRSRGFGPRRLAMRAVAKHDAKVDD